jgi:hypothetical protein
MSTANPNRHLLVEFRYKPSLRFYAAMDKIGLEESESFPDWERSPLTVEIWDRKHHRRAFLSHKRSFYEVAGFTKGPAEIERALGICERLHRELGFTSFQRVGIRQSVGYAVESPYEELNRRFIEKWHGGRLPVESLLRGTPEDAASVLRVRTAEGWEYFLRCAPMRREEWFETIPHDPKLFESPLALEQYKETIHEKMLCFDVDGFREDVAFADVKQFAASVHRLTSSLTTDLLAFLRS